MNDRPKVLIVDDDQSVTELIRDYLEKHWDSLVVVSPNTLTAIKEICTYPHFTAVVCDYSMPGLPGTKVKEFLEMSGLDIPFIGHSSHIGAFDDVKVAASIGKMDLKALGDALVPILAQRVYGGASTSESESRIDHD